jgi:hypothetical protein
MMGVKGGIGTEVNVPLMSKQDNSHIATFGSLQSLTCSALFVKS